MSDSYKSVDGTLGIQPGPFSGASQPQNPIQYHYMVARNTGWSPGNPTSVANHTEGGFPQWVPSYRRTEATTPTRYSPCALAPSAVRKARQKSRRIRDRSHNADQFLHPTNTAPPSFDGSRGTELWRSLTTHQQDALLHLDSAFKNPNRCKAAIENGTKCFWCDTALSEGQNIFSSALDENMFVHSDCFSEALVASLNAESEPAPQIPPTVPSAQSHSFSYTPTFSTPGLIGQSEPAARNDLFEGGSSRYPASPSWVPNGLPNQENTQWLMPPAQRAPGDFGSGHQTSSLSQPPSASYSS